MNYLSWLVGHRLETVLRREYDWLFVFDRSTALAVGCLWRLLEEGRIRVTSEDDGHRYGLPASIDAADEAGKRLANATVESAMVYEGTLDLELRFASGHILQVLPTSSGYEAWQVDCGRKRFTAIGGGELAVFDDGMD